MSKAARELVTPRCFIDTTRYNLNNRDARTVPLFLPVTHCPPLQASNWPEPLVALFVNHATSR